ncbi:hypothetical protein [Polaribacter sp. OB-PA-B3]
MKTNKILLVLTLIVTTLFTSCEEQENVQYDVVNGQTFVQFSSTSAAIPVKENEASTANVNIEVTTVSDQDRTINVSIDESSTAAANAYQINSIVIPAGEFTATASITGVYENVPLSGSVDLVLNITGIEGQEATIGNGTLTVSLERFCPSDLEGEYYFSDGNGADVTVTRVSEGNYTVSRDNYFGAAYAFEINDRCNMISVTGSVIESSFGIPTSGEGTVLANGDISIKYTVDGYTDKRQMTLVKK